MGGAGTPPDVRAHATPAATGNVTAFKRPPRTSSPDRLPDGPHPKPRLPVALIFACLVVVYVGLAVFLALSSRARTVVTTSSTSVPAKVSASTDYFAFGLLKLTSRLKLN